MRAVWAKSLVTAALIAIGLGGAPAAAQEVATPLSKGEVEQIVRDYLLKNPEIVIEAIQSYQAQQQLAEQQKRQEALAGLRDRIYNDPNSPDNGVTDYDVTLIEFFDYQCHYCKKIFPDLVSVMDGDKRLRVVFKELPILGPASTFAARAALAARKQGRYMEFHMALMDLRGQLSDQRVMRTAAEVGLDTAQLSADMNDPEVEAQIRSNLNIAQEVGISGTPALLIGNKFIPGFIDKATMLQLVAEVRETQG